MMDSEATRLAAIYLAQLEMEARQLPPDQAADMVADIREHIAMATAGVGGEVQTREVLDRLGSPQALVAEALGNPTGTTGAPSAPSPLSDILATVARRVVPSTTWSSRETGAILSLIGAEVGAIVFPFAFVAWLWGLRSVTTSRVWTSREKLLGGLTLGLGFPLAGIAVAVGVLSLQWSLFSFGVHQVCTFGGAGNPDPSLGFGNSLQPSACHSDTSWARTTLTTLAIIGTVLLVAQIVAVWKLLRARHRVPAA
jgi:hypothetical protein